jgi:hypothetical protein
MPSIRQRNISDVNYGSQVAETRSKIVVPLSPIDQATGHWGTFSALLSVLKELHAGVVQETDCMSFAVYRILPVACVGGYRNQSDDL